MTKGIIYPRYYPKEVVDFFGKIHCYEHIVRDIEKKMVYVLEVDDVIVGTGSFEENHITRLYVLPKHEKQGYITLRHDEWECDNKAVLVYDIMKKTLD